MHLYFLDFQNIFIVLSQIPKISFIDKHIARAWRFLLSLSMFLTSALYFKTLPYIIEFGFHWRHALPKNACEVEWDPAHFSSHTGGGWFGRKTTCWFTYGLNFKSKWLNQGRHVWIKNMQLEKLSKLLKRLPLEMDKNIRTKQLTSHIHCIYEWLKQPTTLKPQNGSVQTH